MKSKFPQFYESAEEIDRMRRRREIRQRLQAEFNRSFYNPHRLQQHIEILDPSVSRYSAMRSAIYEHWKPNWGSFWKYAIVAYVPVVFFSYRLFKQFEARDKECRSGEIPYEKRDIRRI